MSRQGSKKRALTKPNKRCGLCGKTKKLTRTECCGRWVCDDADQYVVFSYARNSCYRNHQMYTLCGFHFNERHEGDWTTCKLCKEQQSPEMYAYFGTNEYNFEVLANPPPYEPTLCSRCGTRIALAQGGYSMKGEAYLCQECSQSFPGMID